MVAHYLNSLDFIDLPRSTDVFNELLHKIKLLLKIIIILYGPGRKKNTVTV